jgi:hypothetical protein
MITDGFVRGPVAGLPERVKKVCGLLGDDALVG